MFHFDGILRIQDLEVAQRRVLVRSDLNCPVDDSGTILDDQKLRAAVPTLRYLLEQGAQVTVAGHRSVPEETAGGDGASLESCAARLAELLGAEVLLPDAATGPMARKLISELRDGQVVVLENLALTPEELSGDDAFARELAQGMELFVSDDLAGPHHFASVVALPRLFRERAIGLRMESELVALNRLQRLHSEQVVLVIGGCFAARRPLLQQILRPNLTICTGGQLANTLLTAQGLNLGATQVDASHLAEARTWMQRATEMGVQVQLPVDVHSKNERNETAQRLSEELKPSERVVDVGLETVQAYSDAIRAAGSAVMLGGFGQTPAFERGTRAMLEEIAHSTAFSVVLNGPDLPVTRLINEDHLARLGFLSTAGDAFVSLMCGQRLAGVESLRIPD